MLSAVLLIVFRGVTDNLIPLYAIGAFLAFTLSQAGMVGHWRRTRGPGAVRSMVINGLGAVATGVTLLVVLVAKFTSGAWISALLIAAMMATMLWVRRHYAEVAKETEISTPLQIESLVPLIVIVPVRSWSKISQRAIQNALSLSPEIYAVHVGTEEDSEHAAARIGILWSADCETGYGCGRAAAGTLVTLPSPYRLILKPILEYVLETEAQNPGRQIAVIVPELVERHWYHYPLHNQRAELLKAFLLVNGRPNIVLISVPWYIKT